MAEGSHPFPYRTRKLSPPAPMVLGRRLPGRVGRRRISPREGRPPGRPSSRIGSRQCSRGRKYPGSPCHRRPPVAASPAPTTGGVVDAVRAVRRRAVDGAVRHADRADRDGRGPTPGKALGARDNRANPRATAAPAMAGLGRAAPAMVGPGRAAPAMAGRGRAARWTGEGQAAGRNRGARSRRAGRAAVAAGIEGSDRPPVAVPGAGHRMAPAGEVRRAAAATTGARRDVPRGRRGKVRSAEGIRDRPGARPPMAPTGPQCPDHDAGAGSPGGAPAGFCPPARPTPGAP
jgi:hypothetical protein